MPLSIPSSAGDVITRAKVDVRGERPDSNPFLPNSILGALINAYGNRIYDFYGIVGQLPDMLLPDTTDGELLERWAAIFGKNRLPATQSTGQVFVTGTVSTTIPAGTIFVSSDGLNYTSGTSVDITNKQQTGTGISQSGDITITLAEPPEFAVGQSVTISGVNEAEYNGTFSVTQVTATSFSYSIPTIISPTPTGTPVVDYANAEVSITSDDYQDTENDINVNVESGSELTLQSPIAGASSNAYVGYTPISGGTNQETNSQLRARTLDKIQNPVAQFNIAAITEKAKEVPGVTRVFVYPITPAVGQVTIYFMRDNDDDPIPDSGEVTAVKNKILEITPINTAESDVIVEAPTGLDVDFTFTSISPNTPGMQQAIINNLEQFFAEETEVGENIPSSQYIAAIQNTIDIETGTPLVSFSLSSPTGNITVGAGVIPQLGTVSF